MAPVMTPTDESNWDSTKKCCNVPWWAWCSTSTWRSSGVKFNNQGKPDSSMIRSLYRSKTLKCMNFNRSLQPLLHLKIPHVALKTTCLTWHDQCTAMIQWHCVTVDLFLQNRNPKQLKHRSIQFHSKLVNVKSIFKHQHVPFSLPESTICAWTARQYSFPTIFKSVLSRTCVTLWFFEFLFFLFAEKMRQGHVWFFGTWCGFAPLDCLMQFLRKKHAQNFGDAGFLTCTNLAAL